MRSFAGIAFAVQTFCGITSGLDIAKPKCGAFFGAVTTDCAVTKFTSLGAIIYKEPLPGMVCDNSSSNATLGAKTAHDPGLTGERHVNNSFIFFAPRTGADVHQIMVDKTANAPVVSVRASFEDAHEALLGLALAKSAGELYALSALSLYAAEPLGNGGVPLMKTVGNTTSLGLSDKAVFVIKDDGQGGDIAVIIDGTSAHEFSVTLGMWSTWSLPDEVNGRAAFVRDLPDSPSSVLIGLEFPVEFYVLDLSSRSMMNLNLPFPTENQSAIVGTSMSGTADLYLADANHMYSAGVNDDYQSGTLWHTNDLDAPAIGLVDNFHFFM